MQRPQIVKPIPMEAIIHKINNLILGNTRK